MSQESHWSSDLVPAVAITGACILFPITGIGLSVATSIAAGLATPLAKRGSDRCMQRLFRRRDLLNHDLQAAMLRAFEHATNDLQQTWLDTHQRDANRSFSPGESSETDVKALFADMRSDAEVILSGDRLKTMLGSAETMQLLDRGGLSLLQEKADDEASDQRNAEGEPPVAEPDGGPPAVKTAETYTQWLKSVAAIGSVRLRIGDERDALRAYLAPYLDGHSDQLVRFMHDRFQSQLACRFGEELKNDTKAWRAFQRLVNDGLLDSAREMLDKQDAAQATLDRVLSELEGWKDRLTRLPDDEREKTGENGLDDLILLLSEYFESLRQEMRELTETTWARIETEGIDTRGEVKQEGSQLRHHVSAEVAQARAELLDRLDQLSGFSSVAKELDRARDLVQQPSFSPHAYYNGRKPVWANIVAEHDAPRTITDNVVAFVTRHASNPVGAPVAVIQALSGDGKSTIAMRTAATLAELGLSVVWHNDPASRELNWKQLDAESRSAPLVAILDDAHQFEAAELEAFLEGLAQVGASVLVVLFARRDLWVGSEITLDHIAEVEDFEIQRLGRGEIQGILAKLEAAGELGQLAFLSAQERIRAFEERSNGQLLIALMEAKESKAFSAIVSRSIRDLQKFPKAVEACYVVSALQTFDIDCSPLVLEKMLKVGSINGDILSKVQGTLVSPEQGPGGLQMRHSVFATVVFRSDPGRYDRIRAYISHLLPDTPEMSGRDSTSVAETTRILSKIKRYYKALHLDEKSVRELFAFAEQLSSGASSILIQWASFERARRQPARALELYRQVTEIDPRKYQQIPPWATLERSEGNIAEARRLYQWVTEIAPDKIQPYITWASMESSVGSMGRARDLYRSATQIAPNRIHIYQNWAKREQDHGEPDRARALYQRAIEMDPMKLQSYHSWAMLEENDGNVGRARQLYRRAVASSASTANALYLLAKLEFRQGDPFKALEVLREAAEVDPQAFRNWHVLARYELLVGDSDRARTAAERAIALDPSIAPSIARSWRAWTSPEKMSGDILEARGSSVRSTKERPRGAKGWQAKTLLEKAQGDIAEARRLFAEATEARPQNAQLWQAWALLEKAQGEIPEARRLLGEATEADPKHALSWQAWALLEREQGNISEARRLFAKATEADLNNPASWQAWALLEKAQGDISKARRLFATATLADPGNAASWQAWALLEKEQGDTPEARRLFEKATAADPRSAASWQAWAIFEKEQGDVSEARRLFAKATEVDPRNSASWNAWSTLELEDNNVPEALRLAEEAVRLQPSNPYCLIGQARAYQAAGRHQEANIDLEKAVGLLERTIKSSPANIKMRTLLAEALIGLKRWDRAKPLVRDTVHIAPPGDAHLAYDRLGDLFEAMNQHPAAAAAWQRALSFMPTFYPSRKKLGVSG